MSSSSHESRGKSRWRWVFVMGLVVAPSGFSPLILATIPRSPGPAPWGFFFYFWQSLIQLEPRREQWQRHRDGGRRQRYVLKVTSPPHEGLFMLGRKQACTSIGIACIVLAEATTTRTDHEYRYSIRRGAPPSCREWPADHARRCLGDQPRRE